MKSLKITNYFAELSPEFYTRLSMQGLKHDVKLLHVNPKVAELLGIDRNQYESDEFLKIMSGQADLRVASLYLLSIVVTSSVCGLVNWAMAARIY